MSKQPIGKLKYDAALTEFDIAEIGKLKLPAGAIDATAELADGVKVNTEAGLDSNGDRFVQEGALSEVKGSLESSIATLQADVDQNEADADAAIAAEEARAQAAESGLSTSISNEASTRAAADTSLDGKITDEENARIAADGVLQTNLNAETSARQAADTVLTDAIAAEEARAQSAEAGLQGNIDAEEQARIDAVAAENTAMLAAVAAENTAMLAAVAAVQADVDQNESDADAGLASASTDRAAIRSEFAAADSVLQTALESKMATDIATAVDGLVAGAPALLDTLNEIAAAIDDDENFATTMSTALATATSDRADIRSEFAAADNAVKAELKGDAGADFNTLGKLEDKIQAEESARLAADASLTSDIAALQADVDQNESDADAAIAAEEAARIAAVSAEESRAQSAEAGLQGNIDAEEAARIAADATLTSNLSTEISDRSTGDAALQTLADAHELAIGLSTDGTFAAHSGTEYLDSASSFKDADKKLDKAIKDEVAARIAAVSAENSAMLAAVAAENTAMLAAVADEASARVAAVSAEASARSSADTTLQSNIDSEASRAQSAEAGLQSNIDTEASARATADSAEAATRAAADTALDSKIGDEETRALAAESVLQSNIDVETARIDAILEAAEADKDSFAEIVTLVNSIDAENDTVFAGHVATFNTTKAALEAADVTLQSNIDSEASRAQSAEAGLQGNIDAEESARIAADGVATTDRAAIRSEFAAADSALQGSVDNIEGGHIKFEFLSLVDESTPATKPYVAATSDVDGRKVELRSVEKVLQHVHVASGSKFINVKLPAGFLFEDGSSFMEVYPGMNVKVILHSGVAYLF